MADTLRISPLTRIEGHLDIEVTVDTVENERRVVDGGTAGFDLVDLIASRRKVVVVDAVDLGDEPGTLYRFKADDLEPKAAEPPLSLHAFGFLEALNVSRRLGCAPRSTVVIGIQPKDVSAGLSLSPEIETMLSLLAELALAEIRKNGR